MKHLFSSTVRVWRQEYTVEDGIQDIDWVPVPGLGNVKCRLDLLFIRPGKDAPVPTESGVVPDRMGVLFALPNIDLRPGDQVECIDGPINGIFEIKSYPDIAQNRRKAHHIELQVQEVAQDVAIYNFAAPGSDDDS